MRIVVQRVKKGKVLAGEGEVSRIESGILALIGISREDNIKTAETTANKVFKLRIMEDEGKKMNLSVGDAGGSFLVVSQFTLYGDTRGGNRPSFMEAARPDTARPIYEHFVECLRDKGARVKTGVFGAEMKIEVELDGPVTILMEE
jgi:D-tyrosyl-tRNA(Tyr) deacylase